MASGSAFGTLQRHSASQLSHCVAHKLHALECQKVSSLVVGTLSCSPLPQMFRDPLFEIFRVPEDSIKPPSVLHATTCEANYCIVQARHPGLVNWLHRNQLKRRVVQRV